MESIHGYINEKINDGTFEKMDKKLFEDEIMAKMKKVLDDGGDIDLIFCQTDLILRFELTFFGTMLHFCILKRMDQVVDYLLRRGANVAIEKSDPYAIMRGYQNSFELAAQKYNYDSRSFNNIFEKLKRRTLELYSAYDLTSFHIDCAIDWKNWSDRTRRRLRTAEVNDVISTESPFWPGMTPLHIAAKSENHELVKRLLDLGADRVARDSMGNTPLHYVDRYSNFLDERLFSFDRRNTYSPLHGENHFQIACRKCPDALNIVKRYLNQGISPNTPLQTQEGWECGLHLAAEVGCPDLIQLFLEYGAEINAEDSQGYTPILRTFDCECELTLIEAGSGTDRMDLDLFLCDLSEFDELRRGFAERMMRLYVLDKNLISQNLKDVYVKIANEIKNSCDEVDYIARCSEELKNLNELGLRPILDGTTKLIVNRDFERKFGWLDFVDLKSFPIYEKLLRIKIKPKLFDYEKRIEKIMQAIPHIQRLLQSHCHIPHLCAEIILWNFSNDELDQFMLLSYC